MLRLGRQRRVAGQHVDLRHERLQARHRLGAAAADLVGRHVLVVGEHLHPDRPGELGHAAADVADADDAERLATQLGVAAGAVAAVTAGAPVTGPRPLVDGHDALRAREHQHQRVLGHGLRVRSGRMDDGDAEPRGRRDVDAVEADTMSPDDLEPLARLHEAGRGARAAPEEDALSLRRRLDRARRNAVHPNFFRRHLLRHAFHQLHHSALRRGVVHVAGPRNHFMH